MRFKARRAVDPIIATLLLIAISVAAGIVVYVFTNGLAGNLTQAGGQQLNEQLSVDAYAYPSGVSVTLYVRNTGGTSFTIDSPNGIFFNGLIIADVGSGAGSCNTLSYLVTVATECFVKFTAAPVTGAAGGTSNQVKLVTKDGGSFVFNVIAGKSG